MSLLRACQQAILISRRDVLRPLLFSTRAVATNSDNSSSESSDIVTPAQVQRDVTVADVISGAPSQLHHRVVRIYQPTRNTMQSGVAKTERWRIDFDILQGGGRWESSLMGWASSADYMQGTRLSFRSKEDAIHFAEKQGWNYYVQPPAAMRIPPKNYAENFVYRPNKLRIARTK